MPSTNGIAKAGLQAVKIIQTPSAAEMRLRAKTPVNKMLALSMITSE